MAGKKSTQRSNGAISKATSWGMDDHKKSNSALKRTAMHFEKDCFVAGPEEGMGEYGREAKHTQYAIQSTPSDSDTATLNGYSTRTMSPADRSFEHPPRGMQTGCIPCLLKRRSCDPRNTDCKLAMSADWEINSRDTQHAFATEYCGMGEVESQDATNSMSTFRPDTSWRRGWRERHSLNFFVNFSAPQMGGFFDSRFWLRMVTQASYHEPAILHAIIAIGSLHESIMQGAFMDESRKDRAVDYALRQCNRSIGFLTGNEMSEDARLGTGFMGPSKLALVTCVLFTCFEAMQGHCDSALTHAMQAKRLMNAFTIPQTSIFTTTDEDDIEDMRALVERLDVQATALIGKKQRPEKDNTGDISVLPIVDVIYSLEHAHTTLQAAMNSTMRFMQSFHPAAPHDQIAKSMAEKTLRYTPWYQQWEAAFSIWLASNRPTLSDLDIKRCMVLKANHLIATMLSSVNQSAGPSAYDRYEPSFRAIVSLSKEVLATFSCPPLPTLKTSYPGTPYLSFSLWVTDPLWMVISRCRNPGIRRAAFELLRENPRQEGIWHAGPRSAGQFMRKVEAGGTSSLPGTVKGVEPPASASESPSSGSPASTMGAVPKVIEEVEEVGDVRARSEWVDLSTDVEPDEEVEVIGHS
jgi:hypothetical protein